MKEGISPKRLQLNCFIQTFKVVEVQPEATSTPKVLRRIEPLPEDRDLGDSSNSDSLESELEVLKHHSPNMSNSSWRYLNITATHINLELEVLKHHSQHISRDQCSREVLLS